MNKDLSILPYEVTKLGNSCWRLSGGTLLSPEYYPTRKQATERAMYLIALEVEQQSLEEREEQ